MKISNETVDRWIKLVDSWFAANALTLGRNAVAHGRDAWTVANRAGLTREAYEDRTITDGHIQTALERIFPNAVFRDKKVY